MWLDWLIQALLAVAAFGALWAFYVAFNARWPEKYWDENKGIDPIISRGLTRYLTFRFGPVLVALLAVGAAADRIGQNRRTVVVITVLLCVAQGAVEMIKAATARPRQRRKAALRGVVIFVQLVVAAGAILIGNRADTYVPTMHETVFAATTALFVFLLGAPALLILSRPEYMDSYDIFIKSRDEIDPKLLARLEEADPSGAFVAVAIVENLNRPPWFRRLERVFIRRRASYGLMQMKSARPISDSQSVDAFIEKYRGMLPLQDRAARWELFQAHNNSPSFARFAYDAFRTEKSRHRMESWEDDDYR